MIIKFFVWGWKLSGLIYAALFSLLEFPFLEWNLMGLIGTVNWLLWLYLFTQPPVSDKFWRGVSRGLAAASTKVVEKVKGNKILWFPALLFYQLTGSALFLWGLSRIGAELGNKEKVEGKEPTSGKLIRFVLTFGLLNYMSSIPVLFMNIQSLAERFDWKIPLKADHWLIAFPIGLPLFLGGGCILAALFLAFSGQAYKQHCRLVIQRRGKVVGCLFLLIEDFWPVTYCDYCGHEMQREERCGNCGKEHYLAGWMCACKAKNKVDNRKCTKCGKPRPVPTDPAPDQQAAQPPPQLPATDGTAAPQPVATTRSNDPQPAESATPPPRTRGSPGSTKAVLPSNLKWWFC